MITELLLALVLLAVAIAALILGAFLTAVDASYRWVSRSGLEKALAERPREVRERVLHQYEDSEHSVIAAALGRVLAETVTAVAITALLFIALDGWILPTAVAMVIAGAVAFVGLSVSPRTLGRHRPEGVLIRTRSLIAVTRALLGPLAQLLVLIGEVLTPIGRTGISPYGAAEKARQDVDRALENEYLHDDERDMIQGVFDLAGTMVRELMVPRPDMVTIGAEATAKEALRLFVRSGYSRIPVVGSDVDDLRGILYVKDVVRAIHSPWDPRPQRPVPEIMRPAQFVPEFVAADVVMRQMQTSRVHISIVVDEYGGVAGIVTIEDVLEEIVGEIADEHDPAEQPIEDLGDGRFRVPARAGISEVGELFGLDIDDSDVDSVGGVLGKALGQVPIVGSEAEVHGLHLHGEKSSGRRKRLSTIIVSVPGSTGQHQPPADQEDPP